MSAGDVPRCPSCGLYLYPSDTATVHLCGVPYPNNAPASYPLKDWRDAEIESLRRLVEVHKADAEREIGEANDLAAKCDALQADNERLRSRVAELEAERELIVARAENAEAALAETESDRDAAFRAHDKAHAACIHYDEMLTVALELLGEASMHEDWLIVWQERCELKKQCEEWEARYERLHELLTKAQNRADRLLTELEKRSK